MKITPSNQSLVLASDAPTLPARRVRVGGDFVENLDAGSVLKSLTIVALRADYATPPASTPRLTQEPIDVLATETVDDAESAPPAELASGPESVSSVKSAPGSGLAVRSATQAGVAPAAAYARTQVQVAMAPKGSQVDVHA